MMRTPLLVRGIAERAETLFATRTVASVTADGDGGAGQLRRRWCSGRGGWRARSPSSASGRATGSATFGWNSQRHLELYLAVPAMGAVLHTLNIRLFDDDLHYIVGHAEDRIIFLDASLAERMPHVRRGRARGADARRRPPSGRARCTTRSWSTGGDPGFEFPDLDENAAAAMCYTSGTTGRPKGVVYSHRSTVLHSLVTNQADGPGLRERDTVMPIVPMFHANAWGLPYAGGHGRIEPRVPGPADGSGRPRAADRRRAGDVLRRGADDLAGDRRSSSRRRTCRRSRG